VPSSDKISSSKRKPGQKLYNYMLFTSCDKGPSYFTVKTWVARFRTEHLSTEEKAHSGRPTQVTIPVNEYANNFMFHDDQRIWPPLKQQWRP
jgi:hypothetical protein